MPNTPGSMQVGPVRWNVTGAIAARLEQLLAELGEPLDGPMAPDVDTQGNGEGGQT